MHMTSCLNKTSTWMTSMSIPYELMKSKFHMIYYCQIMTYEVCDEYAFILSYKLYYDVQKMFSIVCVVQLKGM